MNYKTKLQKEYIRNLSSDKKCELSQISEVKEMELYIYWLECKIDEESK